MEVKNRLFSSVLTDETKYLVPQEVARALNLLYLADCQACDDYGRTGILFEVGIGISQLI